MVVSDKATLQYLLRTELSAFYQKAFNKFDGSQEYYHSWYIDLLCEYLEAFAKKDIKRLNINIPPRFGKLLSDDTPILTTKGWKNHGELKEGDYVYNMDGEEVKVLAVSSKMYANVAVKFTDGEVICCHENHEWIAHKYSMKNPVLKYSTKHIMEDRVNIGEIGKRGNRYIYKLPKINPIKGDNHFVPVNPYVFGVWLGDGTTTKPYISGDVRDKDIINKMEKIGYSVDRTWMHKKTGVYTYNIKRLNDELKKLGFLMLSKAKKRNKYIPDMYLTLPVKKRLELLAGLIDTDGTYNKKEARYSFTASGEELKEGVVSLLYTLGIRATICKVQPRLSTSGIQGKSSYYQISFSTNLTIPCALSRKRQESKKIKEGAIAFKEISKLDNIKQGNCIEVEGGIYLAGRTLKPTHNSALCNVAFSMWMLGNDPTLKIITISYSATLSQKLHGYARAISNSSWYQQTFPVFSISEPKKLYKIDLSETKNTQSQFITTKGGFRIATSVGASITGEGGNILIFDDMMNPKEATSYTETESALQWTRSTAFSRFNNRKEGQILNIQQRLSETDFTASFVDNSWESVIIPVQAKQTRYYDFKNFKHTYTEGEFLEPKRYSSKELEEDKRLMGQKTLEAQFFQNPYPDDGEIFRRAYFKYYNFLPQMEFYSIYADTASKEGRYNDFTVFMCFGLLTRNNRKYAYLIDILRDKMTTPKLLRAAKDFWHKHYHNNQGVPLIKFAIEDKSSGTGLIQLLEHETNIPVTKLTPEKDKVARANDILPRMESGQVLFPSQEPWIHDLEQELLLFSMKKGSNKKDQVDTLTYAIKDLLFDPINDKNKPLDYTGLLKELVR